MTEVELTNEKGPTAVIPMGGPLAIHVRLDARPQALRPVLGVVIKDHCGTPLFSINNRIVPGFRFADPIQEGEIVCRYQKLPLMPGHYNIDLYLGNESADLDIVHDAITFEVEIADVFGSGKIPPAGVGSMIVPATWTLETRPSEQTRNHHAHEVSRVRNGRPD